MIAFLLMNASAALTVSLILKYFLRLASLQDYLIAAFITYFALIVLTLEPLGIFNLLFLKNVLLLLAFFLFIVYAGIRIFKIKTKNSRLKGGLASDFTGLKRGWAENICIAAILGFALAKIAINLINPPFGWDNLNYHFTFPVEWLKHGNLDTPIVVSDDPAPSYYPINGSLFFLWLILPFKSVFLADLSAVPFFILIGLLIYQISRLIGLEKKMAFYAAALFILIPNVFKQLEIAYVDIMVCAFFLAALYYILKIKNEFRLENIILAGVSSGLLIGIKNLALPYALTLFLPLFFICISRRRRGAAYLVLFAVLVLLFGGFSYIRNFIWTKDILYPIDIEIFGKTLFKGVIDKANYGVHFLPADFGILKLLFHEGLGGQGILFIVPGMLLTLIVMAIKRRKALSLQSAYLLLLPLLLYLIWRFLIPLANTRYLYPAFALAMVFGFYILEMLNIPKKAVSILVVICVLASLAELARRTELIGALIMSIVFFFMLNKKTLLKKSVIAAAAILFLVALPFLERNYSKNEYARYKHASFWRDAIWAWAWLNENTTGNNVSYVGRPVPFPLYGERFQNNVYYTSVNSTDPAKLHFFKNSRYIWKYDFESCHKSYEAENNYRGGANYDIWLNNLKRRKTEFLFIYSLHQTKEIEFPLEDKWAMAHSNIFTPVFSNKTVKIYKILNKG